MQRPIHEWRVRGRGVRLGERTLVMGVVNVTPDSFSDGGAFLEPAAAVEHALRLLEEGADILDLGGESTRPGASVALEERGRGRSGVSAEEELRRVMPVLEGVRRARADALLSVDTYKSAVARAALEAGADIINDVSGLRWDEEMAHTLAGADCGVVLMHMRGRPEEWRRLPPLEDPVGLVTRELREWSTGAVQAGIARERMVLDPGFGFGKSFAENYPLIARFREWHALGYPLLAGTSRKSFLGRTLARGGTDAPPAERLHATVAATTACILEGAHIVRVHDVRPAVEAAKIADAILAAG
jgi:dihydropteroate synthase